MAHVYDEIYAIVQRIPRGRVLTYGVISHMIGGRMSAQGVGWALKALGSKKKRNKDAEKANEKIASKSGKFGDTKTKSVKSSGTKTDSTKINSQKSKGAKKDVEFDFESVPWQRVVNSQGGTSTWKIPEIPPDLQRILLEAEGIVFDEEGKMDLSKYVWLDGDDGDAGINKTVARKPKRSRA
ncbi:MAG TPA: MGMT family protein [Drouetiella sp.]